MPSKPAIDYTSRDWAALGTELETYIRQRFPNWNDFNAANVGNVFKELVQYLGDGLHYYLDRMVNEAHIDTATQRESILALAQLLDYQPKPRAAATAQVVFTLESPAVADVIIRKGLRLWTTGMATPLPFELQADVLIRAGQQSGTGLVKQCETKREVFTVEGRPWLELPLTFTPFLPGRLEVRVNGALWTPLESLLDAEASTTGYEYRVDAEDRGWIKFGDGLNGVVPAGTIEVVYEVGGGVTGNVQAGLVNRLEDSLTDVDGRYVAVTVTNPEAASGGEDPESIEEIRRHAPRARRANERSVAREDFEAHAEMVPGVARALCLTKNEDSSLEENLAKVIIVPVGGGTATPDLLAQVDTVFRETKPAMLTLEVQVASVEYTTIDVAGSIRVKTGYDAATVRATAEDAVRAFFDYEALDPATGRYRLDFGRTVYLSALIAAIMAVDGVEAVTLTSPTGDVSVPPASIAGLGTLSLGVI